MASELKFVVTGKDLSAAKTFQSVSKQAKLMGDQVHKSSTSMTRAGTAARDGSRGVSGFGKSLIAAGVAGLGFASIRMFKSMMAEATESAMVLRQTEAVLKSTGGVARVSAAQVGELAESLSAKAGVDDEVIQSAENVLLTFTKVRNGVGAGNDIFKQASVAALDMAASLNHGEVNAENLQAANIRLGKALNDPIKGVSALSKAGVQFTQSQKDQIGALVKSGNVMGAQKVILAEMSTQFKGSAEASATPMKKLTVSIDNIKEALGNRLLPVVNNFAEGIMSTFKYVGDNKSWLVPLIGGVVAAAAAFKLWTAINAAWTASTFIATVATVGFSAALQSTGIPLIIAAIAGLVVGIVALYKNCETFRKIVDGTWKQVTKGAQWMWATIKPVFGFLKAGFQLWMAGARIYWDTILKPVFSAIGTYFKFVWGIVKPILGFLKSGFQTWMVGARIYWNTILKPVFGAIGTYFKFVWGIVKPVLGFLRSGFQTWMIGVRVIWNSVLKPVFSAIGTVAKWLWTGIFSLVFMRIKQGWSLLLTGIRLVWNTVLKPVFTAVGAAGKFLWDNVLKPVFARLKQGWQLLLTGIKIVWTNVLKPVFNAVGTAVLGLRKVFDTAVTGIRVIWDKLKGFVKTPIKFIIDTVLNKGLIAGWEWISKYALGGAFPIPRIKLPGFATGGIMPGYSPGRDDQLAAVSGGEAIMRPEWTRAVGPDRINAWNRLARKGGPAAINKEMNLAGFGASGDVRIPAFADGGIFGRVKNFGAKAWDVAKSTAKGVTEFLKDPSGYLKKMMEKPLAGLRQFKGSQLGKMLTQVPAELVTKLVAEAKSFVFGSGPASAGGGGEWMGGPVSGRVKKTQDFLKAQHGKPYIWASAGPNGYDCSGIVSAAWNMLSGKNPYSHTFSTSGLPGKYLAPGPGVFSVGYSHPGQRGASAGIGHTAGNLAGLAFESGGALGNTHVGAGSTPVGSFASIGHKPGVFDRGGWLLPGKTAMNTSNRAERIPDPRGEMEVVHVHQTIQMDNQAVYKGLLKLKRRLGGTWELA